MPGTPTWTARPTRIARLYLECAADDRSVSLQGELSVAAQRRSHSMAVEVISRSIFFLRGRRVILDSDLAGIYGVTTGRFNEAVKRNIKRFPEDFMLRLSAAENAALISQSATSKPRRGGRRKPPRDFPEHGARSHLSVAAAVLPRTSKKSHSDAARNKRIHPFLEPSNANAAPCGSAAWTIQPPPGTSCGPCMILPPLSLTRLAAASISPTLK
jgi:hypothetical protein